MHDPQAVLVRLAMLHDSVVQVGRQLDKDVNILVLGHTGCGMSSFVNTVLTAFSASPSPLQCAAVGACPSLVTRHATRYRIPGTRIYVVDLPGLPTDSYGRAVAMDMHMELESYAAALMEGRLLLAEEGGIPSEEIVDISSQKQFPQLSRRASPDDRYAAHAAIMLCDIHGNSPFAYEVALGRLLKGKGAYSRLARRPVSRLCQDCV